eukprot:g34932.t1
MDGIVCELDIHCHPACQFLQQHPAQVSATQHVTTAAMALPSHDQPLEPAMVEVQIPEQRCSWQWEGMEQVDHVLDIDQVMVKDRQHPEGNLQILTVNKRELRTGRHSTNSPLGKINQILDQMDVVMDPPAQDHVRLVMMDHVVQHRSQPIPSPGDVPFKSHVRAPVNSSKVLGVSSITLADLQQIPPQTAARILAGWIQREQSHVIEFDLDADALQIQDKGPIFSQQHKEFLTGATLFSHPEPTKRDPELLILQQQVVKMPVLGPEPGAEEEVRPHQVM